MKNKLGFLTLLILFIQCNPKVIMNRQMNDLFNKKEVISPEILNQLIEFYRKVRNTIRFLLGNLYDFYPSRDKLSLSQLEEVDRFMLSFTSRQSWPGSPASKYTPTSSGL